MPRPAESEPLQKHTLLLYAGDFDKLGDLFPSITASVMVRKVIRAYIQKIEAQAANAAPVVEDVRV